MKLLTQAEVERLAFIGGETDLGRWQDQMAQAEEKIERDIEGNFQEAFARCLPLWTKTGRIRDLAHGIRVTKYWPHYTTQLGDEFAYKFRQNDAEILRLLNDYPPNSCEYLCICDLLILILEQNWLNGSLVPELFKSQAPVPEVLRREFEHDNRFDQSIEKLGSFLKCFHEIEHEG